ncbi:hypothetical protein SISSUDRAFT_987811 [Sistotremastrum suecicum HHB10207 ss-3]|uniref:Alpha/beta hydrolase fold-3 domain-containing protein n=1 Tax=Sistotremastrum suecicum HHB10207 ss-3 TaxID=1314776 RepID=A0A166CF76_9AGAM|nr:hypothetical protein SISSUDRAFT_987811 [Sistotremastrum suecicum HHB10207 ss-3]
MTAINPLHPSIIPRLDPEYVEFYTKYLANVPSQHQVPWTPDLRNQPAQPGGSEPLKVGEIRDFSLAHCKVRVFTPEGEVPDGGWPVFLFFHGGGWTLGGINAEASFATNICKRASTVVVSVDYRLGPEEPFPAAVDDAWDALQWIYHHGAHELGINTSKIALGGSSSGGNLAAVVAHKASLEAPHIPLVFQLLIVPVTDNTVSISGHPHASWVENQYTPSLSPEKMLWFRRNYLPRPEDWGKWEASPLYAPDDSFRGVPKTWIGVAELDILRDEGIAYGEKLKSYGKEVTIKVYPRAPHPIMANDGDALQVGRQLISDACDSLKNAFQAA